MYFFDDNLLLNHNNTTKTMSFPNKSSWLIREKKVVFTRRASEIELRLGLEAQCLKPSPRAAWGGTGASEAAFGHKGNSPGVTLLHHCSTREKSVLPSALGDWILPRTSFLESFTSNLKGPMAEGGGLDLRPLLIRDLSNLSALMPQRQLRIQML